ncbi:aminopeptidase P family protein [Pusillimonas sp. CC-YST705]|uniref:Aminopeptidase P family protein n=1 Tax=Mesopusillimonas faecipullorum TaxID=2755040 RepID=A0ABS8C924_9BURK|nr:aminopeptidase P family protein [Mesopusillimonas faecipullorum]MCB5362530.1 aminopeptidase P family protein [Mesopusillimonas faecipullorum]
MQHDTVYAARIAALQSLMTAQGLSACVVLSSDPHLSEYLPEHWQARAWFSGFTGSAGTLVVTQTQAGLWTDSRYWEQAEHDLAGTGILLMRAGAAEVPAPSAWLAQNLAAGARVAVDGMTISVDAAAAWGETLKAAGLVWVTDLDLAGQVWAERPALPAAPVYEHLMPYACRSRTEKLAAVRAVMQSKGVQWHWVSTLDDIAWLLNLRGADVSYNPVFLSHLLVGPNEACLFVAEGKVDSALAERLAQDGVRLLPYEQALSALRALSAQEAVLVDPARVTAGVLAGVKAKLVHAPNPTQLQKACKTEAELQHVRAAMEQDGAALCEFFAWFESALGREPITELTVDEQITAARARREHFVSPSFSTIAAFNANGAMPHYQASPDSYSLIDSDGLLLIDSGGQYLGGTTDITRVVPVGNITQAHQEDFTLVLKGMIALSRAVFPTGTPGPMLDALARQPLWQAGLEFGHGTGHGVGYFLNVHEGPQSISYRSPVRPESAMRPGMITSNEPGLYRPGRWGIRIENLVACVPAQQTEFGQFLRFETLTLCPIDTRCIDRTLLDAGERAWLNDYHTLVRERLAPWVTGPALAWLQERTQAI